QPLGDFVERVVPRDRPEGVAALALLADPAQRHSQAVGMVLPLGVAADLGTDDALRVGLPRGAAHAADRRRIEPLDRQRAGARAIMRADAIGGVEWQRRAPAPSLPQNISRRAPGRYAPTNAVVEFVI